MTNTALAVHAAGTHCRYAVDELHFPNGPEFYGAILPVHRVCLHKHSRHNVVAAIDVQQQFGKQVAYRWTIIQMMVRIDDRKVRFDDRFLATVKPVLSNDDWRRYRLLGENCKRRRGRGSKQSNKPASVHCVTSSIQKRPMAFSGTLPAGS